MKELSPIVLFVYKRPWHTKCCLESLEKNQLADSSILYIYADGPRVDATIEDLNKINDVRQLIRKKNWCNETHIIEAKENKGLGNSVIDGVTEIVNRYGKIIVLEDDLVLSTGFLNYMNDALALYENEHPVMHISGYMYPVKAKLPDTFFYNSASCWGWATWARAWKYFSANSASLWQEIVSKNLVSEFTIDHTTNDDKLLQEGAATEKSELDIQSIRSSNKWHWDMCMQASVRVKKGFCLHPFPSLVRNIGHDETGVHCKKGWWSKIYNSQRIADQIRVKKIKIENNVEAWQAMKEFNKIRPGLWIKVKEKVLLTLEAK